MAKIKPVARSTIGIGGPTTTWSEGAASGDSYVTIGHVRTMPNFGDSFQEINVDEVNDGRTRKAKGSANAGTADLVCSRDDSDPGQQALLAAAESQDAFNFKVTLPNGDGTFDVCYVSALVMSKTIGLGGANDTQTRSFTLSVTEAPIDVPAGS